MARIVQKFGGTSVADPERIGHIADRIKATRDEGHQVVAVVSAMSGETNRLLSFANEISARPDAREVDVLLSTGEQITIALLALSLQERGCAARSYTGAQVAIRTDDVHSKARIQHIDVERMRSDLAKQRVIVVAGFQGVNDKGDITTLGRGGSDTSAVALAAALDADRCEIYSDVDGIYSADPAVVADARHLPEISYPEMQEISTAGAKVLNAHAVQFAKEKNIALYARSTFHPGRETIIRKLSPGKLLGVQAVVREKQIERVRMSGKDVRRHFQQAISYLETEQVPVKEVSVTHVAENGGLSQASFVVPAGQIYGWKGIKSGLEKKFGAHLSFDTDLAAVSLIGEGLNRNNQTLLNTLELLAENSITTHAVTTTSFRISLLVPRELVDQSVQLCHDYWITSKRADPIEGFEGPRVQGVK